VVPGFGVVEKDKTVCILLWVLLYLLICFFLIVLFSWESAIKSGVWMNLTVCLLHSVRIKKNIKCGVVEGGVVAEYKEFSLKFTYLWEHDALFTLSGGIPEVCTWPMFSQLGAGSYKYPYLLQV
jgi:hypothetical protein